MGELSKAELYAIAARHGITGDLARCMLGGAWSESRWDTDAVGDRGASVGLFQLHSAGLGSGLSVAERQDPDVQFRIMAPEYTHWWEYWGAAGYADADRAVLTCAYAERPLDYDVPGSAARQGYRAGWEHAAEEAPAPDTRTYNPDLPAELQRQDWTCSIRSTAWALKSLGFDVRAEDLQDQMVGAGLVSSDLGLLDGSGSTLANWVGGTFDLPHEWAYPADWDWVAERAGRGPILLGGRAWNHWVAVRRYNGDGLLLANPAPNWQGVGDYLDRDEWETWGPWAAIWLPAEQGGNVTDESRATVQRIAEQEILRNITEALAFKLPKKAREKLEAGAKPAAETLSRGEF